MVSFTLKGKDRKGNEQTIVVTNANTISSFIRYGFDFDKPPTKKMMVEALEQIGKVPGRHFDANNPEEAFKKICQK